MSSEDDLQRIKESADLARSHQPPRQPAINSRRHTPLAEVLLQQQQLETPVVPKPLGAWLDNESRAEQLLEARACGEDAAAKRVTMSMLLVIELFGPDVILPLRLLLDCPGETLSEVVMLRKKSATQCVMFVHDPLLSTIKAFSHHHRVWKRGEAHQQKYGGTIPTVVLELGMKKEGSRSMYMGVFFNQGRWQSQIRCNKKLVFLGHFKTEIEAARVYDSAMTFKKGDKAKLNFPNDPPTLLTDLLKARMSADDTRVQKSKAKASEEGEDAEDVDSDEIEPGRGDNFVQAASQSQPLSPSDDGIMIVISLVETLFGSEAKLPMMVLVDCVGEERQRVCLRKKSSRFATFYFSEPLRSKIKECHPNLRKWSVSEEGSSDGMPLVNLALGVRRDGRFIGVSRERGRWVAKVCTQGRSIGLGSFDGQEEAARAFDIATHFLKGDRAKLNFPDEVPEPLSDALRAKLLSAVALPQLRKKSKRSRGMVDEEEMEMDEEEKGEPWEEEKEEEEAVMEEVEEEEEHDENDPYYSRIKRVRERPSEMRSRLHMTHRDYPAGQTNDEEHARAAAEALMSLLE